LVAGKNIRAFCHEVNSAEEDVFSSFIFGSSLSQFERVTSDIGKLNYFISLIVVAQDHCPRAKSETRLGCAFHKFWIAGGWEFAGT
jgi:hypothetical protein